jgi:hypothetical protein
MAFRPRLTGIAEGLVVAAIVWGVTTVAARWQSGLGAEAKAKIQLDPLEGALVALPPALVVAVAAVLAFVAALAALLLIHWVMRDKSASATPSAALPVDAPTAVPENTDQTNELKAAVVELNEKVYQASLALNSMRDERDELKAVVQELTRQRDQLQSEWKAVHRELAEAPSRAAMEKLVQERDDARREVTELRAFPQFVTTIQEIETADPVVGPDLYAVIIVAIANNGAPSVAMSFKVSACTVWGANIEVDVLFHESFTIALNAGKDCKEYRPEHYIMTRTRNVPVQIGNPITGALPCAFRGVTDAKNIDFRSLAISFSDGTGDVGGNSKEWESAKLTEINYNPTVPSTARPGLPMMFRCPPQN